MAIALVLAGCSSSPSPETAEAKAKRVAKEAILGIHTHLIVLKAGAGMGEYNDIVHTMEQNPQVIAAEGFVFTEVSASRPGGAPIQMMLKGVDPTRVPKVEALARFLIEGSIGALADPEPRILLGDQLANTLGVKVGDTIEVVVTANDFQATQRRATFHVAGRIHTGFDEYDRRLSYTSLASVQPLVGLGDQVTGVEATVKDLLHSDKTAEDVETALGGPPYQVKDWFELNQAFFVTRE
jgi:lipoprotein-releasing system permease protein